MYIIFTICNNIIQSVISQNHETRTMTLVFKTSQPSASKIPAGIKLVEEGKIDVENIEKSKPQKCVARGVCLQKIVETNAIPKTVSKHEDFLVAADCQCSIICNGWITEGRIVA